MKRLKIFAFTATTLGLLFLAGCGNDNKKAKEDQNKNDVGNLEKGTFGYDARFLAKHKKTIVLGDGDAKIAVCPAWQGRVMTSTANGDDGLSYGWINHELIESAKVLEHINPVGGEDRFWMGPEGGQFSIFFRPGAEFTFDNWQTPAVLDTVPYDVVEKNEKSVFFHKEFEIGNYSGNTFRVKVERKIALLSRDDLNDIMPVEIGDEAALVAYQSVNTITNTGDKAWTRQTGALSIWVLGMFNPSDGTTIIVPFRKGSEVQLGPIVNDAYFGKVPADRLVIGDGVLFFSGDGQYRSKIGLSPRRALNYAGSYDENHGLLTIIFYSRPEGAIDYINSMWEMQDHPFAGDVVNAYNDGPVNGKALGPFYELESSSPSAFLKPGASLSHTHTTVHIQGDKATLDPIVQALFQVDIKTINSVFQ